MKIERMRDENGIDTYAYFTRGYVNETDFARAMVAFINESEDKDEWWDGPPPVSGEIHCAYWRHYVCSPGDPFRARIGPGQAGRQGSFPVTYYCYEGMI